MSDTLESPAVTASTESVAAAGIPLSVTGAALEACIKAYRAGYTTRQRKI